MENSKSELYIVAIVGVVAIVALVILVAGGHRTTTISGIGVDATGAATRSYELGACHYDDGSSSGCPCSDPSDGILSIGSSLIETSCK